MLGHISIGDVTISQLIINWTLSINKLTYHTFHYYPAWILVKSTWIFPLWKVHSCTGGNLDVNMMQGRCLLLFNLPKLIRFPWILLPSCWNFVGYNLMSVGRLLRFQLHQRQLVLISFESSWILRFRKLNVYGGSNHIFEKSSNCS